MVMPDRRAAGIDIAMMVLVAVIGAAAALGVFLGYGRPIVTVAVLGLTAVGIDGVYSRMRTRVDHLQARHSRQILDIANESLNWMRRGLTYETAEAVCRIALEESEAAAVAMTDIDDVLGFAGVGEDHHAVGGPIITAATRDALVTNELRILQTREEIGCPRADCPLSAAIVVPLEMRSAPVGTLKFYYTSAAELTETQVTMVEGLGRLLSTQLELSELQRQTELATRMELKALQSQIDPHFLFNTINTIAALIRTDPPKARELLREFAAFYRRTLENSDQLITLSKELEYVRKYVLFEQARFGDRVEVRTDVPPEVRDVLVPAFILQPIVENAVQHGMPPTGTLHVRIAAVGEAELLHIVVTDDGVGMSQKDLARVLQPGFGKGLGIALKNVDDRLKGYFGQCCGLKVESREGQGTTVTLTIALAPAVGK
jgi:two-component system, LytTR family, sensor histidine kinase LytS